MKQANTIYVIKMGGEIINNAVRLRSLCNEIAHLKQAGIPLVLVHGGGIQVNDMEIKLGNTPQFIHGRRITNQDSLDILKMVVAGKINADIISTLQCQGVSCVGLSGI